MVEKKPAALPLLTKAIYDGLKEGLAREVLQALAERVARDVLPDVIREARLADDGPTDTVNDPEKKPASEPSDEPDYVKEFPSPVIVELPIVVGSDLKRGESPLSYADLKHAAVAQPEWDVSAITQEHIRAVISIVHEAYARCNPKRVSEAESVALEWVQRIRETGDRLTTSGLIRDAMIIRNISSVGLTQDLLAKVLFPGQTPRNNYRLVRHRLRQTAARNRLSEVQHKIANKISLLQIDDIMRQHDLDLAKCWRVLGLPE